MKPQNLFSAAIPALLMIVSPCVMAQFGAGTRAPTQIVSINDNSGLGATISAQNLSVGKASGEQGDNVNPNKQVGFKVSLNSSEAVGFMKITNDKHVCILEVKSGKDSLSVTYSTCPQDVFELTGAPNLSYNLEIKNVKKKTN
ncbi:hypothetical protein BH10PSE19_BH10PSE19_01110 [soil metagenome]